MNKLKLVIFMVDDQKFAIPLSNVGLVVNSVEIQPLLLAPEHIRGLINLYGEFLPVVNFRRLFNLPEKAVRTTDKLIITEMTRIKLALLVDTVVEVAEISSDEISKTQGMFIENDCVEGLFKLRDDLVLINDLDKFLTNDQIDKLKKAIEKTKYKRDSAK